MGHVRAAPSAKCATGLFTERHPLRLPVFLRQGKSRGTIGAARAAAASCVPTPRQIARRPAPEIWSALANGTTPAGKPMNTVISRVQSRVRARRRRAVGGVVQARRRCRPKSRCPARRAPSARAMVSRCRCPPERLLARPAPTRRVQPARARRTTKLRRPAPPSSARAISPSVRARASPTAGSARRVPRKQHRAAAAPRRCWPRSSRKAVVPYVRA